MKQNSFFQGIVYNWPARVLSLLGAVMLFVLIQVIQMDQRTLYIPLEIRIPPGYEIMNTHPDRVELTLTGPYEEIYSIFPEHISAFADFTDVREGGVYTAPVRILTGGSAEMIDRVTLKLDYESLKLLLDIPEAGMPPLDRLVTAEDAQKGDS